MLKDPIFVFNAPNWFQVIIVFIEWHYSEKRTTQPINPILQFGCLIAVTHKRSHISVVQFYYKSTNLREKISKNRNWWFYDLLLFILISDCCWRNIGRLISKCIFFHWCDFTLSSPSFYIGHSLSLELKKKNIPCIILYLLVLYAVCGFVVFLAIHRSFLL